MRSDGALASPAMRSAVALVLAAFALALPAAASSQAGQHRTPAALAWNHQWTHHGRGSTDGPTFHVKSVSIHWYMQWICPPGPGYGMHVNVDEYRYSSQSQSYGWHYHGKVYAYGPPNNHAEGETVSKSGIAHIDESTTREYRFSFHASHACRYAMRAQWN
jgi:hypothetical protein